jgi:hypothetical protein
MGPWRIFADPPHLRSFRVVCPSPVAQRSREATSLDGMDEGDHVRRSEKPCRLSIGRDFQRLSCRADCKLTPLCFWGYDPGAVVRSTSPHLFVVQCKDSRGVISTGAGALPCRVDYARDTSGPSKDHRVFAPLVPHWPSPREKGSLRSSWLHTSCSMTNFQCAHELRSAEILVCS